MNLIDFARQVHQTAVDKGFWDESRNKAEMIALMHSELSALLEGIRKPGPDTHCPELSNEAVELADLVIRAFDYAVGFDLPLIEALEAKAAYNERRERKHGKAF